MFLFEAISLFNFGLIVVVGIELLYSLSKKDGVHSLESTAVNTSSFVIGLFFRHLVLDTLYISVLSAGLYTFLKSYIAFYSVGVLSFIGCFVLVDLIFYLSHRLYHATSFFWAVHFTHHSDRQVNASTFLRASWMQKTYQWAFLIIPLFFGFTPRLVLLCLYVTYAYQLVVHSPYVRMPLWLETFLVTPRSQFCPS